MLGPTDSAANPFLRGRAVGDRPWVIAHRGDSAHAPENTLEAARIGWEAGADAWEFDVRLTRDKVPVVLHDASLRRTTDVARRFAGDPRGQAGFLVADFDLDEVRTLDAGGWFLDPGGGPRSAVAFGTMAGLPDRDRARFASGLVRLPTLAEALALTARLDWAANIELKDTSADDPTLIDRILGAVSAAGATGRVTISSFDHGDVSRIARRRSGCATGVLADTPIRRPAAYVREVVGADAYHPSARALGAEAARYRRSPTAGALRRVDFDALRAAEVPVFVYTVNDASAGGLADHLAEAGAAGLFTDDPGALAAHWGLRPRGPA